MPTLVVTSEAAGKAVAVVSECAVASGRSTHVEEVPYGLAHARLMHKLCPDCGSSNVTFGYLPNNWDPGDVDPTATCNDCGWGY